MKFAILITFAFILFVHTGTYAQGKTDVIVMKNGDRITCEIKGLERGVLFVGVDYVDGTLSVQWAKVARIESKHLFLVRTGDGEVHQGNITTTAAGTATDKELKIEVAESTGKQLEVESSDVVSMDQTSRRFFKRFNGDLNVGLNYTKGHRAIQYNLGSSIELPGTRWLATAEINSTLSDSADFKATTRNQLKLRTKRILPWRNYFYIGGLSFLQSSEQKIGMQSNLSLGLGYRIANTNHAKFSIAGGFGWQRTHYTQGPNPNHNATVAVINTEMKFFKFRKTSLDIDATLIPVVSEPGRIQFKLDQKYYIKIISNLTWNISFYGYWDNRPPSGLTGGDYGTSTGLGWTFGNK